MAPIGFLVIDKPAGITSHDVVTRIRKRFDTPKVGHLGTLDPMATGVLPIAIGKATRLVRFVSGSPKEYAGRIRLGQDTSTGDADGDPAGEPRPVEVTGKQVAEWLRFSATSSRFRRLTRQRRYRESGHIGWHAGASTFE